MQIYDVIIVGAGPAGACAAMFLKKTGKKVLLLDKDRFPRDKICGDAQSKSCIDIIKELRIYNEFTKLASQKIYGMILSSPNSKQVSIDTGDRNNEPPMYTNARVAFDNFLFESAKKKGVKTMVFNVTDIIKRKNRVEGVVGINEKRKKEELRSKITLGADGSLSIVARKTGVPRNPSEHEIIGLRQYYKNVKGTTDCIEYHFLKNIFPGYLWIFPLSKQKVNVGMGLFKSDMQKKKINLKQAFLNEIKQNPVLNERFKDATALGNVKEWPLPLASHPRQVCGDGFMLLGDAAGLIDPLTGGGTSSAMISAKIASEVALDALEKNDFSKEFLQRYDQKLENIVRNELKSNYRIQRVLKKFPFLINKAFEKAVRNESFRETLGKTISHTGDKSDMISLIFLFKLFMK